ncbi:MAG: hypothetical protein ACM3TR_09290 [Caulobacteraceae bacterium]
MDKRKNTIIALASVVAAGTVLPILAAFILYGFSVNYFKISNFIFTTGLFVSAIGGLAAVIPFSFLKAKLRKNPRVEKLEVKKREGLLWEYILLAGGVIIIVISYLAAVL